VARENVQEVAFKIASFSKTRGMFPFAPSGLGLRPFPEMSGTVFEQKGTKNQEN
tara:strand:- start:2450 stop:2611 length:162 start_codon:yes stop_codon:yes gene_type:complete